MKKNILVIILYIARFLMSFIYFFIKLFPMQKNKITMLSRQSNEINIDFEMIVDEIKKNHKELKVKVLCKKIPNNFMGKIEYCFYVIKCLYHIATSKVCIVDGYVIPISALKHKKGLIIVQIWHALGATKKFGLQVINKNEGSNKNVAEIMRMHKNYTFITCTSEATREFYSEGFNTEKEKILTLGMPRIDYLLNKDNKIGEKEEKLLKNYPILKEKETILYVPTFRKEKGAYVEDLINIVDTEKYNLIIKLHPLDKTKVEEKYTIGKQYNTFDLLKIADYIITDYSAVAFEAAVLDKPIFFYLYDIDEYKENRGMNVNLKEEMSSSTFDKVEDIMDVIINKKYNYDDLQKFKNKYIETANTHNTERILDQIIKLMEE